MPEIKIHRRTSRPFIAFQNRKEAGKALVDVFNIGPEDDSLVLALPRGGIPVAEPLAQALGAPLKPVLARKLPLPVSPEMGFGAVAVDGSMVLNERVVAQFGISKVEIENIADKVRQEVRRRAKEYSGTDRPLQVKGKKVYMVDDGLATGYTMIAAARMVNALKPESLSLCVPVSPAGSIRPVEPYFNQIFCIIVQEVPPFAVASFYQDFHDLSDQEVRKILERRNAALNQR